MAEDNDMQIKFWTPVEAGEVVATASKARERHKMPKLFIATIILAKGSC